MDDKTDGSFGFLFAVCYSCEIENCCVCNLVNHDGGVQGFYYVYCEDMVTRKCNANNLQSHFEGNILTDGHTVAGFLPISCANLLFEKCCVEKMIGCCDDVHGISVFMCEDVELNNIKVLCICEIYKIYINCVVNKMYCKFLVMFIK